MRGEDSRLLEEGHGRGWEKIEEGKPEGGVEEF